MYSIVLKDEIYINSKLEQFFGMPELIERLHQIYIKSMKITKNFKIQICVSSFKSHSVISTICNGFLIKNTRTSPAWLWLIFMLAYIYLTLVMNRTPPSGKCCIIIQLIDIISHYLNDKKKIPCWMCSRQSQCYFLRL